MTAMTAMVMATVMGLTNGLLGSATACLLWC